MRPRFLADVNTRREAQLWISDSTEYGYTLPTTRSIALVGLKSDDMRTRKGAKLVISEIDRQPLTFIQVIGYIFVIMVILWLIFLFTYGLG